MVHGQTERSRKVESKWNRIKIDGTKLENGLIAYGIFCAERKNLSN